MTASDSSDNEDAVTAVVGDEQLVLDPSSGVVHRLRPDESASATTGISRRQVLHGALAAGAVGTVISIGLPTAAAAASVASIDAFATPGPASVVVSFQES